MSNLREMAQTALDEIECDLLYLFGRASLEGHKSGQRLALAVREKMRTARAALAQPDDKAQPVTQTEYFWLVELFEGSNGNSAGFYHTGFVDIGGYSRTTKNPHEARRYTKEQAIAVAEKLGTTLTGTWRAVEHGFETALIQLADKAQPVAEVYRGHYGGRNGNVGFDGVRPLRGAKLPPPGTKLYAAPQPPAEQGCNCRWNGGEVLQRCQLHQAWFDTIHEWAERAKDAEKRLRELSSQKPAEQDAELSDGKLLDIAEDFKSQYMHGGITFDEFDSLGFARAAIAADRAARGGAA